METTFNIMSDRYIPFDEDLVCDNCERQGAFDFMGDYVCAMCYDENYLHEEEIENDDFISWFRSHF